MLVFAQLWLHEDKMHRRRFIALLGATIPAARALRAQQKAMPVIGFLGASAPSASFMSAFRQGLSETGYIEGQNLAFEYRWAENNYNRLPALAADLVGRKVDVIVAFAVQAALAARDATSTIPIVFAFIATRLGWASSPVSPGRAATSRASATLSASYRPSGSNCLPSSFPRPA
jgi:putative tryptophan/tyrosine transport system substrate-binding protein